MRKNVTLSIDEEILKLCRYEAVEQDKSLSQWVTDVLTEQVKGLEDYRLAKERARKRLSEGYHLGGVYPSREEAHER